jgi:predicted phage terminase large subunit-like protein
MTAVKLSVEEIEAERERRERGEELSEEAGRLGGDLRSFIRNAWHILEPVQPYHHGWHIDCIAEHLEAAYRREIRRLIINVPPRHMKSLTVSVFGPAWRWTHAPSERFLTASYGDKLATDHAKNTRTVIQSAWYRARWGDVFSLTSDQNVKTWYENDRRGIRMATSVGGSGTGFGGDVIVVDDPHNTQQALSDVERAAAITWHDQTISTRFNDPSKGVEIVVMQRLHEADLTGHLLAKEDVDWFHLCLPAEYEPRLMVTLPGGRTQDATSPADPRVEPGELLWPEHFPAAEVARLKGELGPYGAAGQLQQRPAPAEGGILKTGWWRYYDLDWLELWRGEPLAGIVTFWDTALKEKTTNDFTVGTVWGCAGANRYLLRRFRDRVGLPDTIVAVQNLANWVESLFPNTPHIIKVENAANGPEVVAKLRDRVTGISAWSPGPHGDKTARAHAITPELSAGQVLVPGRGLPDGTGPDPSITPAWVLELVGECAAFPNAANDDQVDSVTGALLNARGSFVRTPKTDDRAETNRTHTAGVLDKVF